MAVRPDRATGSGSRRHDKRVASRWMVVAVATAVLSIALVVPPTSGGALESAPQAPALTVTPADDLTNLEVTSVDGSGFEPFLPVVVLQCPAAAASENQCRSGRVQTTVDSVGVISTPFQVMRIVYPRLGQPSVDCAVAAACEIRVQQGLDVLAVAGIRFAPGPLPLPTAMLSASTGVLAGQTIQVTGANWDPGAPPVVYQCATGSSDARSCAGSGYSVAAVSGTGHLSAEVQPVRALYTDDGIVDCATAGACVVSVGWGLDTGSAPRFDLPIELVDDGPIPLPALAANPSTGLIDGQVVEVHGTNLVPITGPAHSAELFLSQCAAGATSYTECDRFVVGHARPGLDGSFTTAFTVVRVLHLDSGVLDCAEAPGACEIRYMTGVGWADTATAALSFATAALAPSFTG